METQKKYHDLVLIDENNETKQFVMKRLVFIFLLFFAGIVIGAFLISLLHNKNKLTTQVISTKESLIGSQKIIPPIGSELQPITTLAPSETDGCSIESLGRNVAEGCSVDEYSENAIDLKSDNKEIGATNLDELTTPVSDTKDTGASGVTNILDLQ